MHHLKWAELASRNAHGILSLESVNIQRTSDLITNHKYNPNIDLYSVSALYWLCWYFGWANGLWFCLSFGLSKSDNRTALMNLQDMWEFILVSIWKWNKIPKNVVALVSFSITESLWKTKKSIKVIVIN